MLNETARDEGHEETGHLEKIRTFFAKDSVIRSVLVIEFVLVALSYLFLSIGFRDLLHYARDLHLTMGYLTKLAFLIFVPEEFFNTQYPYPASYGDYLWLLHILKLFVAGMVFTGINYIFKKRKYAFFYYFLATFPMTLLLLLFSFTVAAIISLFYFPGGRVI